MCVFRRGSRGGGSKRSYDQRRICVTVQLRRALRSVANEFVEITVQLQYSGQVLRKFLPCGVGISKIL